LSAVPAPEYPSTAPGLDLKGNLLPNTGSQAQKQTNFYTMRMTRGPGDGSEVQRTGNKQKSADENISVRH